MGSWIRVWILLTSVSFMHVHVLGLSVHFKAGQNLYVALDQTLVLEAIIEKKPDENIDTVTWDRERGSETIRLSSSQGGRISFEKADSILRISKVTEVDFAVYKVAVTDSNGYQQHISIEVRKIEAPPKALVMRVLECVLEKSKMSQWDSPQFSWTIDGVAVTDESALSADGSRLIISEVKGVNYTCTIKSSLGTQVMHYQLSTESQEPPSSCTALIIILVLALVALAAVVAGLIFLRCRRKEHSQVSQS